MSDSADIQASIRSRWAILVDNVRATAATMSMNCSDEATRRIHAEADKFAGFAEPADESEFRLREKQQDEFVTRICMIHRAEAAAQKNPAAKQQIDEALTEYLRRPFSDQPPNFAAGQVGEEEKDFFAEIEELSETE